METPIKWRSKLNRLTFSIVFLMCASAFAQEFGEASELTGSGDSTVVPTDLGTEALRPRTLGQLGLASKDCDSGAKSPEDKASCLRRKLSKEWEREFGVSIDDETSLTLLAVGQSVRKFRPKFDSNGLPSLETRTNVLNLLANSYALSEMDARKNLAEQIKTSGEFSVSIFVPSPEDNADNKELVRSLNEEMEVLIDQIGTTAELMQDIETRQQVAQLKTARYGANTLEKGSRLVDALITKIDDSYTREGFADQLSEEREEEYRRIKELMMDTKSQLEQLESKKQKLEKRIAEERVRGADSINSRTKAEERFAGSFVLARFSKVDWRAGSVQTAVLMVQSPALTEVATAMVSREQVEVTDALPKSVVRKGKGTTEFVEIFKDSTVLDILGTHLILQENGEYALYSVSMAPAGTGNLTTEKGMREAAARGRVQMYCALFAHVMSEEQVNQMGALLSETNAASTSSVGYTKVSQMCGAPDGGAREISGEEVITETTLPLDEFNMDVRLRIAKISPQSARKVRANQREGAIAKQKFYDSEQQSAGEREANRRYEERSLQDKTAFDKGLLDELDVLNNKPSKAGAPEESMDTAPEAPSSKSSEGDYNGPVRNVSGGSGF